MRAALELGSFKNQEEGDSIGGDVCTSRDSDANRLVTLGVRVSEGGSVSMTSVVLAILFDCT